LNKGKFRGLEVIITSVLAINYPWSSSVFHGTQESNIVKPIVDVQSDTKKRELLKNKKKKKKKKKKKIIDRIEPLQLAF
jgi:hypothetical protein